ncbi:MAG TPA: hypothetical protein VGO53_01565, partial [Steroidobacteraceae bacterium]|nr:hypothetical protein [Steroidobacteraceae bacterium]
MRVLIQLRRRGVLKVATAYLAVSWLTLEIGHTLFNIFELPHTGLQAIFVLLALGFPLALMATWQGWFGAISTGPVTAASGHDGGAAPEGGVPEHTSHHEGPTIAVVFGTVALIAVAVAIGVRFFGMGHS